LGDRGGEEEEEGRRHPFETMIEKKRRNIPSFPFSLSLSLSLSLSFLRVVYFFANPLIHSSIHPFILLSFVSIFFFFVGFVAIPADRKKVAVRFFPLMTGEDGWMGRRSGASVETIIIIINKKEKIFFYLLSLS